MTILVILLHNIYSSFSTICFSMDNLLSQNAHNTRATVVILLMVLDANDISSLFRFFFHLLNSLPKEYEGALQPQYDSSGNDPLFWKSVTLCHLITVLLLGGLDQQLLEIHHISLLTRTLSLRQPFSVFIYNRYPTTAHSIANNRALRICFRKNFIRMFPAAVN